jgi:hypothetical protein
MGQRPGGLARQHVSELKREIRSIGLDGRWFGGCQDGVPTRAGKLLFQTGKIRQVVVDDQSVVLRARRVEAEFAPAPYRAVPRELPRPDRRLDRPDHLYPDERIPVHVGAAGIHQREPESVSSTIRGVIIFMQEW